MPVGSATCECAAGWSGANCDTAAAGWLGHRLKTDENPSHGGLVSVKSFGAVGDGSADDGPAIQRAIDSTEGKARAALYFPTGVYLTNQSIVANSWVVRLVGDGMGLSAVVAGGATPMVATLTLPGAQPNNDPSPRSRTNGFEISDMSFSGSDVASFADRCRNIQKGAGGLHRHG